MAGLVALLGILKGGGVGNFASFISTVWQKNMMNAFHLPTFTGN